MKLKLSPRAAREFSEAVDYLIERNPSAAMHFADTLETAFDTMVEFPNIGKLTELRPVRAVVLSEFPYKIFYRVDGDLVIIESVFHTSQDPDKI